MADDPISCACGCGEALNRFDEHGRPRSFITGHNSTADLQDEVLRLLSAKKMRGCELVTATGRSKSAISNVISRLKDKNRITRDGLSWVIATTARKEVPNGSADEHSLDPCHI